MDIVWDSFDLMRVTFLIGAVLALAYKKKLGVTPGGIIAPGTLALLLFNSFIAFATTILVAIATWTAYKYTIGRYALSRRWSSLIVVTISVVLGLLVMALADAHKGIGYELMIVSLITPGLLAISALKYKPGRVALGALVVTAVTYLIGYGLAAMLPYDMLSHMTVELGTYTRLGIDDPYIVFPISLFMSILIYYTFGIRGGGYLIAPFFAAVALSSVIQAALLVLGVALSYLIIRFSLKYTLIIGLERFVLSLFLGYVMVTCMDLLAASVEIPGYRPAPLALIVLIAVITNDLSLQPLKPSLKKGVAPAYVISYITRWAV